MQKEYQKYNEHEKNSSVYYIRNNCSIIDVFYLYIKYSDVNEGEQALDFETILIDGSKFRLPNLQGKYVLLDFCGSWCTACRREYVKLHQKYIDKLSIVTVALEKELLHWKKVAQKDGFT